MAYKLASIQGFVICLDDGAVIPTNSSGYRANSYKEWLAADNVPQPADPIPAPTLSQKLSPTDYEMARASEDLIVLLISKGIITKADLSASIITNINARRAIRGESPI